VTPAYEPTSSNCAPLIARHTTDLRACVRRVSLQVSGHYAMHVTIGGAHVVGSPCQIAMLGAEPEISACEVRLDGLPTRPSDGAHQA